MRLLECLRLRVKDLDIGRNHMVVRDTKGNKDCVTLLPEQLKPILQDHLRQVKLLHQAAVRAGFGVVWLPAALARKHRNADKEW